MQFLPESSIIMVMKKSYRLVCRNPRCGSDYLRYWPPEEFEKLQYNTENGQYRGIGCQNCGMKNMIVMRSSKSVKDGFKPGFQRNIMEFCSTYKEYQEALKRKGLVEIGYEEIPQGEEEKFSITDEDIKRIRDKYGISMADVNKDQINEELQKEIG